MVLPDLRSMHTDLERRTFWSRPAVGPTARRLIEVGIVMDREIGIILVLIAAIGMISTLYIVRRERIASMGPVESPFATSTEGEKRCLKCGLGNLVTSATCAGCDARLPD